MASKLEFAPAAVDVERRADGTMVLRSPQPLGPRARCVTEWLVGWAAAAPARTFLAERDGDGWRTVSYREAHDAVRAIGQALLDRGLGPARPVAILSDNGVDHALLALGAMHVGVPVAPISPAYSLMSKDFGKLAHVFGLVRPGLVFAADPARFASALAAVGAASVTVDELRATTPGPAVDAAFAALGPASVAKLQFTTG